jgi:hypothetical protein
MTSEERIRDILQRHLGATAPISAETVHAITMMINGRPPNQPWIVYDFRTCDKDFERFRKALHELKTALPAVIEETDSVAACLRSLGAAAANYAQKGVDDLRRLSTEVDLAVRQCGPRRPPRDPRSRWHPTARAFASFVEFGYRATNKTPPPRTHVASPLVLAVRDLLAEAGMARSLDQIAKALPVVGGPTSTRPDITPSKRKKYIR